MEQRLTTTNAIKNLISLEVRTRHPMCTCGWEQCPSATSQSHGIGDDVVGLSIIDHWSVHTGRCGRFTLMIAS